MRLTADRNPVVVAGRATTNNVKGWVEPRESADVMYCVLPLKVMTDNPFCAPVVSVGDPNDVASRPFPDLSFQVVTTLAERTVALESAASNQIEHPGIVLGSNPKYCCAPKFTPDAIVYSNKNELFEVGEMTSVTAFDGGMITGLVIVTVFAIVTLRKDEVAFLNWKNVPPCVVEVVLGFVMVLKPEFVMYT